MVERELQQRLEDTARATAGARRCSLVLAKQNALVSFRLQATYPPNCWYPPATARDNTAVVALTEGD